MVANFFFIVKGVSRNVKANGYRYKKDMTKLKSTMHISIVKANRMLAFLRKSLILISINVPRNGDMLVFLWKSELCVIITFDSDGIGQFWIEGQTQLVQTSLSSYIMPTWNLKSDALYCTGIDLGLKLRSQGYSIEHWALAWV